MLVTIKCERCEKKFLHFGRESWQCVVRPPGFLRRFLGLGPIYVPIPIPMVQESLNSVLPAEFRGRNIMDLIHQGHIKTMGRCWCNKCSLGFDALLDDMHDDAPKCRVCKERGVILGELVDKVCPVCAHGVVRRAVVAII